MDGQASLPQMRTKVLEEHSRGPPREAWWRRNSWSFNTLAVFLAHSSLNNSVRTYIILYIFQLRERILSVWWEKLIFKLLGYLSSLSSADLVEEGKSLWLCRPGNSRGLLFSTIGPYHAFSGSHPCPLQSILCIAARVWFYKGKLYYLQSGNNYTPLNYKLKVKSSCLTVP